MKFSSGKIPPQRDRRGLTLPAVFLPALLLPLVLGFSPSRCAAAEAFDAQLDRRIQEVQREYLAARGAIVSRINRSFRIDFDALHRLYQGREHLYQSNPKLRPIEPEYRWYQEARLVLENDLERSHLLKARSLEAYEKILDSLIESDPLLNYFFLSPEYRQQHGLLLKRVVWELEGGSSSAKPLDAYTVFTDRTRMPFLIKVGPGAFTSLAFLRSILIHELNHLLIYKEPVFEPLFADLKEGTASGGTGPKQTAAGGSYSFFFNLRHGGTAGHQYYLIHEYFSFRAQLLYDETAPPSPTHRLSPADRAQTERLAHWAFSQLTPRNKQFIQEHPEPPIQAYLLKFRQEN